MVFSFDDFEINMTMMEQPRQGFHIKDYRGYSKAFVSIYADEGKWSISDGFMVFVFDRYKYDPESGNISLWLNDELCGLINTEGCKVGDLEGEA